MPYAGVSLAAAWSSPKRRYVPLVEKGSSSHSAFSARLPGWTFVVRSPMEAWSYLFTTHFPFLNTSLQFWRQYFRIILIKVYRSVDSWSIHCSEFTNYWLIIAIIFYKGSSLKARLLKCSSQNQMLAIRLLIYSWIYSGFYSSRFLSYGGEGWGWLPFLPTTPSPVEV